MALYLLRRVFLGVGQLLALAVLVFLILQAVPGDPVKIMLGERASEETIHIVREDLGLNDPIYIQLLSFLGKVITGNFGDSLVFGQPIATLIGSRVVPSLTLIVYGLLIAIIVGGVFGAIAALREGSIADFSLRIVATALFTMPVFWVGLILMLVFGIGLGWFPVSGHETGWSGALRTLTLPAIALALSMIALVLRTLRASMTRVLGSEFVEATRARGYTESRIVIRHVARNSLTPTIAVLAFVLGNLIGGTAVLEEVFSIPGLGSLLVQAVERRDYPVVQVIALLAGSIVIVAGLIGDLLQAMLDPRVRSAISNG